MRLHRLIAIMLLLESRKRISANELASGLEVSIRTIQRDIDILCESGIPIYAESGRSGGYSLLNNFNITIDSFYINEIVNLYLNGIGFRLNENSEANQELQNALRKLEKILPPAFQTDVQKAKQRFYFDPEPWWTSRGRVKNFAEIRKAVFESRKLEIHYLGREKKETVRVLRPYGLVSKQMIWYLNAFCEVRKDLRVFRCEGFQKIRILKENFVIPEDFVLKDYWKKRSEYFRSHVAE